MVSIFSIIISVFILLEVCHDSDLIYIGETGAKWYTGQNDRRDFLNDDAIYDVSYSN